MTVAAGLEAGLAVLTGLSPPAVMPPDVYRRLAADLTANGTTVVADVSIDALAPALAGGIARGLETEEVLRLAVAAGALNVTRRELGTGELRAVERVAQTVRVAPAA